MAEPPENERKALLQVRDGIQYPAVTVHTETVTTTFSHQSSEPLNSHHPTAQALDTLKTLPEPTRTLKWIFAFFEERKGSSISQRQLYRHYKSVFGRWGHEMSAPNFLKALTVAFSNVRLPTPVANNEGFKVEGIALRTPITLQFGSDLAKSNRWLNKQVEARLLNLFEDLQANIQAETQASVQVEGQAIVQDAAEAEAKDPVQFQQRDPTPVNYLGAPSDIREGKQDTSRKRQRTSSATGDDTDVAEDQNFTRKARKSKVGKYDESGPKPRLVFSYSTVVDKKNIIRRFEELGGTIVHRIQEANIVCVGKGTLKKTSKLLLAIILGKTIVTEQWLISSAKRERLLDPKNFLPRAAKQENDWGFSLKEAIDRGPQLKSLLDGRTIVLTTALKDRLGLETFKEYKMIVSALGARRSYVFEPATKRSSYPTELYIGMNNDADTTAVARLKVPLWDKDMIPLSVLRGGLQTNSEFQIGIPVKEEDE